MAASNVEAHRAGHEAFNERDFEAMTERYADSIAWTDHAQGRTFRTRQEFRDDFLPGWVQAHRHPHHRPRHWLLGRWPDGGLHLHRRCYHDGPLGPFPATGKQFALPLCELWHFDPSGRVVGGDLYYDQVSLLTQLGSLPQPSSA